MSAQNAVNLTGRITKDLELRKTQDNSSVLNFGIAVKKSYTKTGEPEANFINCVAFGKRAENINQYFKKGSLIGIQGEWETGSYQNKEGQTVYTNACKIDSFQFLEPKTTSYTPSQTSDDFADDTLDIASDLLPF